MASSAKAAFTGFSREGVAFLTELAANQSREWFEPRKALYERELRDPLAALVASLGLALAAHDIELNCDPKRAIFRIYRDVRFGKDKSPYKTHISAAMSRDGDKGAPGVLYLHIEPAGSFAASGFYMPQPGDLHAIRERIVGRPKEFADMMAGLRKAKLDFSRDDALKRTPRGFEQAADPAIIDILRLKTLVVTRTIAPKTLHDGDKLVAELVAFAQAAAPLLRFGWSAITAARKAAKE